MTTVGVVVLHYRNWPAVGACLRSVLAQGVEPGRVCVVDNDSGDGSVGEIRKAFPDVMLVEELENRGYAAGMNAGIRRLDRTDFVLLVTHDCVLAEGALAALTTAMERDPELGIVGPLLTFRSTPWLVFSAGGVIFGRRLATGHRGWKEPAEHWVGRPPQEVDFVDGACLLVRAGVFDVTGLLDEGYFLYFEETDFALRAARRGWRVACVPQAEAGQEPAPRPEALWVRNRLRFLQHNAPIGTYARQCAVDTAGAVRRLLSLDPDRRRVGVLRLRGVLAPITRTSAPQLYRLSR